MMNFTVEVNNITSVRISKAILKKNLEKTVEFSELPLKKIEKIQISVAFVDSKEIQQLNKTYRKKNSPTDVLSFSEYEKTENLLTEKNKEIFLGELILCDEYIAKNAKEDREDFNYALAYIFSHGILHLLGFSHGKKMFEIQKEVAREIYKK